MSELAWTHDPPAAPGLYLRNNPPVSAVVRERVVELEGELLLVNQGVEGGRGLIPVDDLPIEWWWYGPIPPVPGFPVERPSRRPRKKARR